MSEWKDDILLNVASIQQGYAFKSEDFNNKSGIPVIKIKNIASGKVDIKETQFYSKDYSALQKYLVKKGDILIAMTGSHLDQPASVVGRVSKYKKEQTCILNQRTAKIEPISGKINNNYLYYSLIQDETILILAGNASGSANQANISSTQIYNLPILLPALSEQEAIGEVLSSLDDKIDLLQQNNKTLEQLAETLFRQWFVEEAEDSWEVSTIGNQFITKGGGTPSTTDPTLWDGNIFWTSPRDLSYNSKLFMSRTSRTISSIGLKKISSGLLPKGTVLLSSRAPIGYLAITNVELAINQGYIACIPNDNYSSWFIHNWLKNNMELIQSSSNGSTFMEISKSVFRELEFIVPPTRVLNKYNRVCENFYNKILANEKQIEQLEFLHDTLLPKLMSGTVRVIN